jgi:biotin carboxylase
MTDTDTDTDTGTDSRPILLVVSSLGASSREPFFQSVSPHYRIWLFVGGAGRPQEPGWELPYIAGYTSLDTLDSAAMIEAARALPEPVAGVVCYDEARVEAAAELAQALGLPTSPVEAITNCRDKLLTRRALAAAGVPQATSVAVRSLDEARAVAGRIGYPVVLKPRRLAASFGVMRADSPADLAAPYQHARDTTLPEAPEVYEDGVLVEEYLEGPEISVDCACFDGRVFAVALAHKESGFAPSFEETGHVVDGADPLLDDDDLASILADTHAAVGFHTGTTHVELRRTRAGWKVIEINARLGGDLIPYLGQLATGTDLSLVAAAIACGRTPDLTRTLSKVATIRFYYPEQDVRVDSVSFDAGLLPPEIERAVPLADPGQLVQLPPRGSAWESRLAQAVAVADSADACRAALEAAGKALVVAVAE